MGLRSTVELPISIAMFRALLSLSLSAVLLVAGTVSADVIDTDYYYRIQNTSAGLERSLDVGAGEQGLVEFKLTNDLQPTQVWRVQYAANGHYRILNQKHGNQALTVLKGKEHRVLLRPIGHEGRQQFKLRHLWGNRYVVTTGGGDLTLNVRPDANYHLNGVPQANNPAENDLMVFEFERRGPIWHHRPHHGGWGPGPVHPPNPDPWPHHHHPKPTPEIQRLTHQMKRLANRLENETQHAMGASAYFLNRMLGNLPVFTIIDNGSLPHRSDFQRTRQTMAAVINNPKKGQDGEQLQKVRDKLSHLQKEVAQIRRLYHEANR